jgi:hypothetical protein
MSSTTPSPVIRAVLSSLMLFACGGVGLPSSLFAQEEKILLLTFQLKGSEERTSLESLPVNLPDDGVASDNSDKAPARTLVRNLVLYLYTPLGSRPIIERAAISITDSSELGSEIQELTELRGVEFRREDFLTQESWLRDVNFDGYSDLILPNSKGSYSKDVYIYHSDERAFTLDLNGEYPAEPRIVKSAVLSQSHPTLLR